MALQSSTSAACSINRSRKAWLRALPACFCRWQTGSASIRGFHVDRLRSQIIDRRIHVRPHSHAHLNQNFGVESRYSIATSPAESDVAIEEETVPQYNADNYLPLRLGQLVNDRYLIVSKLGFGTSSTVWLTEDRKKGEFYALKACTRDVVSKEIAVSDLINALDAEHPGIARLRSALDNFVIQGPTGQHQCLVFEPCGMSLRQFIKLMPDRALGKTMLQQTLLYVFLAVDVLHQLGVVHTDLSPNNILLGVKDKKIFAEMKQSEAEVPSTHKVVGDHVKYRSRAMPIIFGDPVITDFGAAVVGEPGQKHHGDVMPNFYRAPEVVLGMSWDDKIDIWSIGVMVWDLFEEKRLFYAARNSQLNDEQHLAEMVALMGPPPKQFLERSPTCKQYWDEEGNWIAETPIPDVTLESREHRLDGEDKVLLLTFVRKLLRWLPEERPAASDLYEDPFLIQWHTQQQDKT